MGFGCCGPTNRQVPICRYLKIGKKQISCADLDRGVHDVNAYGGGAGVPLVTGGEGYISTRPGGNPHPTPPYPHNPTHTHPHFPPPHPHIHRALRAEQVVLILFRGSEDCPGVSCTPV